jgi:hypothetical protein
MSAAAMVAKTLPELYFRREQIERALQALGRVQRIRADGYQVMLETIVQVAGASDTQGEGGRFGKRQ